MIAVIGLCDDTGEDLFPENHSDLTFILVHRS